MNFYGEEPIPEDISVLPHKVEFEGYLDKKIVQTDTCMTHITYEIPWHFNLKIKRPIHCC